jgi:hypothetical protein
MNPMKALGWLVVLGILSPGRAADELAVSSPTMIEPPPLTQRAPEWQMYGSVGTSGTNAVFVGNKPAGDGTMNLFLTRLDEFGRPVQAPPRLIASEFYTSSHAELYPADGGFFLRYFDRTNRLGGSRLVATRIDMDGNVAFPPVVISTNVFKESDTASNGRSLLLLVENYNQPGIKLDYTIVGWNGGILSTGVLEGASGGHSFAAASDGKDFLAVWSASAPPYLRVTRFSGSDGSLSTTSLGTNTAYVQSAAHGKNGYLVAGGLMQLGEDGSFIARTNVTFSGTTPQQMAIFPEGEGWILFTSDSSGMLRSYRVSPTSDGLRVERDPYPATGGILYGTFTPALASTVAPFGPGQFLVVRNNGVSVLTKTGVTSVASPPMYAQQINSVVVASPFGYLAVWTEVRPFDHSLRGLRFAPDGTPLDDHSFEIATFFRGRERLLPVVFDGKDYIVAWSSVTVARISPYGEPDLRRQSYSINTIFGYGLNLTAHKGELFASFSSVNISAPYLLIWKLDADGQAGPEVDVHGFELVSDGANLFSVGVNDKFQVFKIAVDPDAANPEISTNIFGSSPTIHVAQLRHGFVLQWFPSQGNSSLAYFSNGQERLRINALTNAASAFADTEERLLMASLPPQESRSRLSRFDSFNLQTGEQSFIEADLGNITRLYVAGSTADFLAVTESFNAESDYVGRFWITTAKPPALAAPHVEDYRFTTTLNLDPKRRYRIETSSDLLNWNLQQVVSRSSSFNVDVPWDPWDSQSFLRAILVPE